MQGGAAKNAPLGLPRLAAAAVDGVAGTRSCGPHSLVEPCRCQIAACFGQQGVNGNELGMPRPLQGSKK